MITHTEQNLTPATRERVSVAAWQIDSELLALQSLVENYDLDQIEHIGDEDDEGREEGFQARLETSLASISTADTEIVGALADEGAAPARLARTLPRCREAVATGGHSIRYAVNRILGAIDVEEGGYDRRVAAAAAERAREDITHYCDQILENLSQLDSDLQAVLGEGEPQRC